MDLEKGRKWPKGKMTRFTEDGRQVCCRCKQVKQFREFTRRDTAYCKECKRIININAHAEVIAAKNYARDKKR